MRIGKKVIVINAVALLMAALALCVSIVFDNVYFKVVAVFLALIVAVLTAVALFRGYTRLISKTDSMISRIDHLLFIQERRYAQLSRRADRITDILATDKKHRWQINAEQLETGTHRGHEQTYSSESRVEKTHGLAEIRAELEDLRAAQSRKRAKNTRILQELQARVERTERRVIGQLENLQFDADRRGRELEKWMHLYEDWREERDQNQAR